MFIYFLLHCKRKNIKEDQFELFRKTFNSEISDLRFLDNGPRNLELTFKAKSSKPYIEFIQRALSENEDLVDHAEFAMDDGSFKCLFIEKDYVREEEDDNSDHIYLSILTGVKDDLNKSIEVWAEEVNATPEQKRAKKESILKSHSIWQRESDRRIQKEFERRKLTTELGGTGGRKEQPQIVKYGLPPKLSKKRVVEYIDSMNRSGEVIIPIYLLKSEIAKELGQDMATSDMQQLFLDFDRSKYRNQIYEILRKAVVELGSDG